MRALTLYYWLSTARVYTCAQPGMHAWPCVCVTLCEWTPEDVDLCNSAHVERVPAAVWISWRLRVFPPLHSFSDLLSRCCSRSSLSALSRNSIRPRTVILSWKNSQTACGSEQLLYTISQEVLQIKHRLGSCTFLALSSSIYIFIL